MIHRFLFAIGLYLVAGMALAQITFDFENQQVPPGWVQGSGSGASWVVSDSEAFSGAFSLRNAPAASGQYSSIEWSSTFSESTLSFVVLMRAQNCCEYFELWIDGVMVHQLYGDHPAWTEVRKPLSAGPHTIRWSHLSYAASHPDTGAWIDDIRVGNALPVVSPLLQQPGGLIVSEYDALSEFHLGVDTALRHEAPFSGHIAFTPDGTLYMATSEGVARYAPLTNEHAAFGADVSFTPAFAALPNGLVGGRSGSCGGYSLMFLASGNVFDSPSPVPCESDWESAVRSGTDLYVLQGNRISRRSAATPGVVVSSFPLPQWGSDMTVDADGSIWVVRGSELRHFTAAGTMLGRYDLDYYAYGIAAREDGLLAVSTGSRIGFMRPDHGFQQWLWSSSWSADIAFVPGVVVDQDADTLPLWWEQAYGLDPASAADALLDTDGDGLSNAQEFTFKSNPLLADTDSDGASDAVEFAAGTNPQDSDSDDDGLSDGVEIVDLGSNPNASDTDGDGMGDLYEFTHGLNVLSDDADADNDGDGLSNFVEFELGTLPTVADTDGDLLSDGLEVQTHGTDPLSADTDADGLSDGAEVIEHSTNPLMTDTDGDGLDDFLEAVTLGSNPTDPDTDGDGMPDAWEHQYLLDLLVDDAAADGDSDGLSNGEEFTHGTRPDRADTDHDDLSDGNEVALGTDPNARDTDGDRLPDGWEYAFSYDPLQHDSAIDRDSDSYTALEEFWWGSDEQDAFDHPRAVSWGTHQGDAGHRGFQPLSLRSDAGTSPVLTIPLPDHSVHPVVAGAGRIFYTEAWGGRLVALDAVTGLEVWRKEFGNVYSTNPPAFSDGRVYVQTGNHSSDTYLHAYDGGTGELVFRSPHGAQWETYLAPTIFGDFAYINGGTFGGAYAFHRVTGVQQWFTGLAQVANWTPAVDFDYVYAYTGGNLDIIDRHTGLIFSTILDPAALWHSNAPMAPVLGGYDNVLGCQGGHITSFDIAALSVAWTFAACDHNRMVAANGVVYIAAFGGLAALEEIDGSLLWEMSFPTQLRGNLVVTRDFVIVSDENNTHFVRTTDQSIAKTLPASGEKTLTEDGRLMIVGPENLKVFQLQTFDPTQVIFQDSFE